MKDPVTEYAKNVTSGKIAACLFVKQAAARHLEDLKDKRFVWDLKTALIHIRFFRQLRHFKGSYAGRRFDLEDWQQFVVGSIYGWKWKESGRRRFRYAYAEIPRKNGKTTLGAGIGLIGLMGEPGAEVYSLATKEDQARLSWDSGVQFIKDSKRLSSVLRVRTKIVHFDKLASFWRPLGSDSKTQDGLNPSTAIIDELHAWKGRDLYDVIDDAQGGRDNPLMFMITTAGYDQTSIGFETHEHAKQVLNKTIQDDSFFAIIYTIDDPEKWDCEEEQKKANPNYGNGKSAEYMRDQTHRARSSLSKRNAFLNKQLNVWTNAATAFLSDGDWDDCGHDFSEETLYGKEAYCGLDLSNRVDLSAFALYFPHVHALLVRFWMPEETIYKRSLEDHVPYKVWAQQGFIKTTAGNAIDYETIENDIREDLKRFDIREVGYDPWNATQTAVRLGDEGVQMSEVRQGMASLSEPTKELERLVISGFLRHNRNPVLDWMAKNVSVKEDENGNKRPVKPASKSRFRIDGISATVMALARYLQVRPEEPEPEPTIRFV